MKKSLKKKHLPLYAVAIFVIAAGINVWSRDEAEPAGKPQPSKTTGTTPATQSGSFNKQQFNAIRHSIQLLSAVCKLSEPGLAG